MRVSLIADAHETLQRDMFFHVEVKADDCIMQSSIGETLGCRH